MHTDRIVHVCGFGCDSRGQPVTGATSFAMRNSLTDRRVAMQHAFAGGHVYALGFPVKSTVAAAPGRLSTAALMSSAEDLGHVGWRDETLAGERAVHHGGIVADFRGKMTIPRNRDGA